MPIISVDHLTKSFGAYKAVDDVSFSVGEGELVALLGSNGAGKTTTLSMLLGLTLPTSGIAEILGHDMATHRYDALGQMNFSSPYVDLPPNLSAYNNLVVFGHIYGVPHLKRRIEELAAGLQLESFIGKKYGQLSAGQKTRVSLAKALINSPRVLLLDEPTASLDPDTADWVRGYLQTIQRETGASILMASHQMDEVERMAGNVLIMHQGRIIERGTVPELLQRYNHPRLEAVFLDVVRGRAAA